MTTLIKKDVVANKTYLTMHLLFIPVTYAINYPPGFVLFAMVVGMVLSTFHLDGKNNVNQFMVSLPVKRSSVVVGRYLFLFIAMTLALGYHALIDRLAHRFLPYFSHPPLAGYPGILYIYCGLAILVSLSIPFFFKFSFRTATGIMFGLSILLMGLFLLVINLPIQENWLIIRMLGVVIERPLPTMVGLALGTTLISFMISRRIYGRRDLVW